MKCSSLLPPSFPAMHVQINYLSQKKNHFSHLLREQQAAISQIVRELRAMRGSLGVIDALHEELQAATEDSSNVSFTTPYYSYLVKRLPLENGASKADSNITNKVHKHITSLGNSGNMAPDVGANQTTELKEDEEVMEEEEAEDGMEEHMEGEAEEREAEEEGTEDKEEEESPVRSKWWLWTPGASRTNS